MLSGNYAWADYTLTITKEGDGSGTVSTSKGHTCSDTSCTYTYESGTPVYLTFEADSGSIFTGWSGACVGEKEGMPVWDESILVATDGDRTCNAKFALQKSSLLELMISKAIVGILSAAGTSDYDCYLVRAQVSSVRNLLDRFKTPIEYWVSENGEDSWPSDANMPDIGESVDENEYVESISLINPNTMVAKISTDASDLIAGQTITYIFDDSNTEKWQCTSPVHKRFLDSFCESTNPDNILYSLQTSISAKDGGEHQISVTPEPDRTFCSQKVYESDTEVELTAIPDEGFAFKYWTGSCVEANHDGEIDLLKGDSLMLETNPVTFSVNEAYRSCNAVFGKGHSLIIGKDGLGTVKTPNIDCDATCEQIYPEGKPIVLTAVPDSGYQFKEWTGGGCSGNNPETAVTMDAEKKCIANFVEEPKPNTQVILKATHYPSKICKGSAFDVTFGVETTRTISAMQAKLNFDQSLLNLSTKAESLVEGGAAGLTGFNTAMFTAWSPGSIDISEGTTPLFKLTNLIPTTVGTLNFSFNDSETWSKGSEIELLTQTNLDLDLEIEDCSTTTTSQLNVNAQTQAKTWSWQPTIAQTVAGLIYPDETKPFLFPVNKDFSGLIFKVTWPGSDLDLKITTPSGQILTKDSPEVLEVYEGDTEEFWVVDSQEQGDWGVDILAIEVDPEGEPYELSIIANERSEPPTEDLDGDGLADEWETYFFGNLSQDATGDIDNDGVSNLLEYQNNLNPAADNNDAQTIQNYTASGVLNDEFGQPIANATVKVGDLMTTTDETGEWVLNGLSEAQHQLIISKAGYSFKPVTFVTSANSPQASVSVSAPSSALSVEIGRIPSIVEQGRPLLSYSTIISNKGQEVANNVKLQQSLSNGHENVVIDSQSGNCNFDGATIQCQLIDIPAQQSTVVDIHSTPSDDVSSLSTNAVVTSNYPTSSNTLITKIYPHFRVNSWVSPSETMLDSHVVYNVRVTNGQYSPAIANNVNVIINLTNGVEFVSAELDNGNCVHDKDVLNCVLDPMPADSTESIKITLKAVHTGMQQLSVKADASNFDAVTATGKVTVNSPESELDKADVIFLIDTTGSMLHDIQSVINALVQLVNELDNQKAPKMGVILFKDQITDAIVTDDLNAIIEMLQNIKVSGGDDIYFCPENAVAAINKAVNIINDNGRIILATDASYHPDTNSNAAEDTMQNKNVAFSALLTGDCVNDRNTRRRITRSEVQCDITGTEEVISAQKIYRCLAEETGGTFTYIEDIKSGSTEAMQTYTTQLLELLQLVVKQVNQTPEPSGDDTPVETPQVETVVITENTTGTIDVTGKSLNNTPLFDYLLLNIGSHNGRIVDWNNDIDCDHDACQFLVKRGTQVTLTPVPDAGTYLFINELSYKDKSCFGGSFTMTDIKNCSATFYGIRE
jgi:Tfp pilus assembly protein PilE/Mg-chelatase subunit ChlD